MKNWPGAESPCLQYRAGLGTGADSLHYVAVRFTRHKCAVGNLRAFRYRQQSTPQQCPAHVAHTLAARGGPRGRMVALLQVNCTIISATSNGPCEARGALKELAIVTPSDTQCLCFLCRHSDLLVLCERCCKARRCPTCHIHLSDSSHAFERPFPLHQV